MLFFLFFFHQHLRLFQGLPPHIPSKYPLGPRFQTYWTVPWNACTRTKIILLSTTSCSRHHKLLLQQLVPFVLLLKTYHSFFSAEQLNACVACYYFRYFSDIFNKSGQSKLEKKYGSWFSYKHTPRANIFRRDHMKVKDMDSMLKLMRYDMWGFTLSSK